MSTPEEKYVNWVKSCGGTKVVRRMLIANNGMAATKFIMSIRNFLYQSFGDDQLIHIIAMATPEDMKASAKHLHLANAYYEVPGGPNFNNYANVSVITSMAKLHQCDCIWPGWGHASENPNLPKTCEEMGIVFVGPKERSMFLLGDKIASTIIAQSAGVPCVAWSGTGVMVDQGPDGSIEVDDATFAKCCVNSAAEALAVAERVGYPIMIKASEGGGGKGVRKATESSQIETMYQQVADEVKGSPIFLMRLCDKSRHVEIQVVADKHRNVAILSGRDCSMQRRFQKIVEEGPPIAVPPETMRKMELAAARLTLMVDYTHAGTVEYLFLPETNEFYFLELNPRLQVEHPVTEGITGQNIPSLQLMIAMGIDLTKIDNTTEAPVKPIMPYILDINNPSTADPFSRTDGHVVAVRITAENASDGWKPTVGTIEEADFQSLPGCWGYFSVRCPNAEVHAFADSQFGHIFAHAPTRKQAIMLLSLALKRLRVVGEIHTNIPYVQELILTDDFVGNAIDTSWLDKIIVAKKPLPPPELRDVAVCGALLKVHLALEATENRILKDYLSRNVSPPAEILKLLVETKVDFIWNNVNFNFEVFRHASNLYTVAANGSLLQAKLEKVPGGSFVCSYAGESHKFHYEPEPGDKIRMTLDGKVVLMEKEKDPSLLTAPYGGKLIRYVVEDGQHVDKGEAYAEVEVMKMLFMLNVSEAGNISLTKGSGNVTIDAGEKLGKLQLDDPSLVAKAVRFSDGLGDFAPPLELRTHEGRLHKQIRFLIQRVHNILDGYVDNEEEVLGTLASLMVNPAVMSDQWEELMAGVGSKLPQAARETLSKLTPDAKVDSPFGAEVLACLNASIAACADEATKTALLQQAAPLLEFGERFKGGLIDMSTGVVTSFIERFLHIEKHYPDDRSELLGVFNLTQANPDSPQAVLAGAQSHLGIERKVSVMLTVLDMLGVLTHMDTAIHRVLKALSQLMSSKHLRVQRKSKQIAASSLNNIVERNKELVMPALRKLTQNSLQEKEEIEIVHALLTEMTLAEAKMLAMLSDSEKLLRKAVAKAAVLLWYARHDCRQLSVRTYLRKGKEKIVVCWKWTSTDGEEKEGFLFVFSSLEDLEANFDDLCSISLNKDATKDDAPSSRSLSETKRNLSRNSLEDAAGRAKLSVALHVLVLGEGSGQSMDMKANFTSSKRLSFRYAILDEAQTSRMYYRAVASKNAALRGYSVETVSVQLLHDSERDNMNYISIFNFDAKVDYQEHQLYRHILPTQAEWLELYRLSNFNVERCWFPDAMMTHVYMATATTQKLDTRFFVRTAVHRQPAKTDAAAADVLRSLEDEFATSLDTLEQAIGDSRYPKTETNHIYLRLLTPVACNTEMLEKAVSSALASFAKEIKSMQVHQLELVLQVWKPGATDKATRPIRIICSLAVDQAISVYEETTDEVPQLLPINDAAGKSQGAASKLVEPYTLLSLIDQKRLRCLKLSTTYAYDYVHLFEVAVMAAWDVAPAACGKGPAQKVVSVELVLTNDGSAVEPLPESRPFGSNKVGMVALLLTMFTPEYPKGREIVLIANDITYQNGTFGPIEDEVFEKASIYARSKGIPRLYLGANSGARFGLSEAVRKVFRVQWNHPYDFTKGINYLWLTDADKEKLGDAVKTERVHVASSGKLPDEDEDEGDEDEKLMYHNKIISIIGTEEGLGVESLQGAGKIAAETSIANREIFTLSYSTARNIGIGSYVLRLGQRVVQHNDAPIILTGFQALNKLLGTNVYESNSQLGGPEVMGGNGVSHLLVDSDLDAVHAMVKWLSFVPLKVGAPVPCLPVVDPVDRPVEFYPPSGTPYDPRKLLIGDGTLSGLLDNGSFVETLADWAKTVVVGRGRLGGMPVGIVATENRLVDKNVLADPANLESKAVTAKQAGQVWFPDSAYKTAQAIQDFNVGEGLPLIVLANWRGFSGGRKDMFEEVLKFGSFIVDQLTQFKQPIIVYIPPHCEIRGGAWVVIDSTINPKCMEMYAAEHARGGVLEPAGIAEIKFRKPELVKAMHRLDKQLKWMSMNEASGVVRPEDIASRETELLPSYQPLGEIFCDLHDRPERMLAKGVIRAIVGWRDSRKFFYWRLKRRLAEQELEARGKIECAAVLSTLVELGDKEAYEALVKALAQTE